MKLKEIIDTLGLSVRCGENNLDRDVTGGCASDMLSNVIAYSKKGDVWVTIQVHSNVVAVAVLKELAAIIIVQGRELADDTIKKANEENVPILVSKLSAYEVAGKMYEIGIGKNWISARGGYAFDAIESLNQWTNESMLKSFRADLHIHTCLSPCGDLKMSPKKIIERVLQNNVDIIAICDHNSAENIQAVQKAAEGKNISVIPGMEICTKEEIHVLALFENVETAFEMQAKVYDKLQGRNYPEVFGLQVIGNEFDEVLGFNERLLIGAVDMSVEETVDRIHKLNGLAIASHIDRESYSVVGQLGFIPETLRFDALELSTNISIEEGRKRFSEYKKYQFIQNSDAHFIDDVGKCTIEFLIEKQSFGEIKKALRNYDGRKVME